ncbi:hypothetical protein EH223_11250 [candidate division KSB1 bacterium]|nr:hypothetical protein [candidate division KSB1 bacterium]RQW03015.1 MAG: hypothetical protein EH223_11250 [candidate division KSB1 bacterium]
MKQKILLAPLALFLGLAIFLVDATPAFAQRRRPQNPYRPPSHRLEIAPFWGYQFGGRTTTSEGEIKIIDNSNYGIQVAVVTPVGASIEFLYSRQATSLQRNTTRPFEPPIKETLFNMNVDYYMLGGVKSVQQGNVEPFGAAYLGMGSFKPQSGGYSTERLFAVALGGGAKIRLSDRIGLRLQGRFMLPMQWGSGGLWCGTGGCNIGVGANTTIMQLDLDAGLVIYL